MVPQGVLACLRMFVAVHKRTVVLGGSLRMAFRANATAYTRPRWGDVLGPG